MWILEQYQVLNWFNHIPLSVSVHLYNVCKRHRPGCKHKAISRNIENYCIYVGIENAPKQSRDMPTVQHNLRSPLFPRTKICGFLLIIYNGHTCSMDNSTVSAGKCKTSVTPIEYRRILKSNLYVKTSASSKPICCQYRTVTLSSVCEPHSLDRKTVNTIFKFIIQHKLSTSLFSKQLNGPFAHYSWPKKDITIKISTYLHKNGKNRPHRLNNISIRVYYMFFKKKVMGTTCKDKKSKWI